LLILPVRSGVSARHPSPHTRIVKQYWITPLAVILLSACGGGSSPPAGGGAPPPPPPMAEPLKLESDVQASSYLAKTTFGPAAGDVSAAMGKDASALLQTEFSKPATLFLPDLKTSFESGNEIDNRAHASAYWNAMIDADDQLRQRMVFALSQIVVASDRSMGGRPLTMAHYMDALSTHAFGNYRDLLKDVTYSPAMARYLTYLRNRKGNENTGRMPDENYAREFLQLFTIGLVELNMDGTPKLGGDGQPIEIFNNDDIVGLAKVFTGLSLKGDGFWNADDDGEYTRLQEFDDQHSPLEKSFLGLTIPANTMTADSIDQAIDHIFDHPNVAPFVSRQLTQRFPASHPSPAYVERVATAFETGRFTSEDNVQFGTGVRGDLQATLAAILLDMQFFDDTPPGPQDGKIKEPALKFAQWARAFEVGNVDANNEWWLLYNAGSNTRLGQQPFQSPSVFNFYRPGFIAPGTATGGANLNAPELQVINSGSVIGYDNFMLEYVYNNSPRRDDEFDSFVPNYDAEIQLAEDPGALADHLSTKLLNGRMSDQTRSRIISVLGEIPIGTETADDDKLTRAVIAVYMAVTSPAFAIEL